MRNRTNLYKITPVYSYILPLACTVSKLYILVWSQPPGRELWMFWHACIKQPPVLTGCGVFCTMPKLIFVFLLVVHRKLTIKAGAVGWIRATMCEVLGCECWSGTKSKIITNEARLVSLLLIKKIKDKNSHIAILSFWQCFGSDLFSAVILH